MAASPVFINVYLKLEPSNEIRPLVKAFNHRLEADGLLSAYHIKPYLDSYPLHVTLYLAQYDRQHLPQIIDKIKSLALAEKPVILKTHTWYLSESNYVMLSLARTNPLDQLSQKVMEALAPLRDKKALIPQWAATNRTRYQLFSQWGSPNVLSCFLPHFSLINPAVPKNQMPILHSQLQHAIKQFSKTHQKPTQTTARVIGIGIADKEGQIVKELESFSLRG